MFDKLRRWKAIDNRLNELENSLIDMSSDIGTIKAQLARIHAKIAVEARVKGTKDPYKELVEQVFGGKIIAIEDKDGKVLNASGEVGSE